MTRARENPLGDFVSEHPWISSLIGASAVGAAAWLGAFLASRAVGASPPVAGKGPKSTTTSTSTNDGATAPTSTTTPTPTTPSTPTFDPAKAVTITIPTGGKEVAVGTSLQVIDGHTGLPVAGECAPLSVLVPGPTDGSYLAIAAGTATIYPVSGGEAKFTVVVNPAVAGVASAPAKRTLPRIIGIRALLGA